MEQLFGGDKKIQAILEQAGNSTGSHGTTEKTEPVNWSKQSLLRNVVERAKELGAWIEDISDITSQIVGNGQENDVFLSVI